MSNLLGLAFFTQYFYCCRSSLLLRVVIVVHLLHLLCNVPWWDYTQFIHSLSH